MLIYINNPNRKQVAINTVNGTLKFTDDPTLGIDQGIKVWIREEQFICTGFNTSLQHDKFILNYQIMLQQDPNPW